VQFSGRPGAPSLQRYQSVPHAVDRRYLQGWTMMQYSENPDDVKHATEPDPSRPKKGILRLSSSLDHLAFLQFSEILGSVAQ